MDASLRALNRFGLGARIGERTELGDPRAWLLAQLRDPGAAMLAERDGGSAELAAVTARLRQAQRSDDRDALRQARRELGLALAAERIATLERRVASDTPYLERLVAFWSNHLCVSAAAKQQVIPFAGAYEREVVRPHVLGRFADMVLASARHPAMLLYLDNFTSIGPGSPAARAAARRGGRERGLNENYARELLELHTLGVNGGYDQKDVESLARLLTGWTLDGLGGPDGDGPRGYRFRPALHEPGAKTLLGKRYSLGGEREGEAAIRDLCAHPATGRFLAGKLVRHFVADEPPASAVERVARVYDRTDGDLGAIAEELVSLDEAWAPEARKLRTPQDWLVASLRAVHAREVAPALVPVLQQLRHPLWAPDAPKGFGDETRDWADPDGLMNRAELARTIADRIVRSGLPPERLLDVVDIESDDPLRAMVSDGAVSPAERVALVLGGPAFQWR